MTKAESRCLTPESLDQMLSADQAARWLGVNKRELIKNCKGPRARFPGFWMNERVVRFNPRAVIAHLAKQSGMDQQTIASMFGTERSQ